MAATVTVPMDRPAPTMTGKSGGQWVFRNGSRPNSTERLVTEPAPTLLASADNGDSKWWPVPATTVTGRDTLGFRGHHDEEHRSLSIEDGALKLTIEEGLTLQSFRSDYPVQGTKMKQWEQIGNAIPPLLAAAVLGALLPP
jgi:DNA (cytosine-5)-methyltransferase 1